MTPRRSTANFDLFVIVIQIIVFFHTVRIWSCRTQSSVDVSVSPRTPSLLPRVYSTDSTCPTAMASESGTLKFPPFPDQFEKWAEWANELMTESQNSFLRVRNDDGEWENCCYLSIILFGLRWNWDVEIWRRPAQNIAELAPLRRLMSTAIYLLKT